MSLMAMPKNTSTTHYVLAGLAVIGSTLCAYAAYAGAGTGAMIDSMYLNYFGMFMTGAFGLGFIFAPEMLMRMKANFGTFDDNHKFLAQFCGFTMVSVCYTIYALTDPDGGFRLTAIWLAGAGLLGLFDEADVVVGTRFHPNSMYFVGGPRKWAMILLSKALSRMAKTPITDSTSGFRSAGPRAISLFAQQYPAEYLGDTVGSLAIAIRNDLVIRETPVTMYYRAIGRPSKNALWSALYLGRASLALFVTLLQRRNPGKKDVS